jgi:benzaldehyde dehydrogenase (NAD)
MTMSFLDKESWQGRIFTGEWRPAHGGVRTVVEPATGDDLTTVGFADTTDLAAAVSAAAAAQPAWAALSWQERAAVLRHAAELWRQHREEVEWWLMHEAGAVRAKAVYEVDGAIEECDDASALPGHPVGEVLPGPDLLNMTRRVPVGVVGVIAPFNAPLKLSIRSVAPALALGNAVILKPDPRTAVSGGVTLARIFEAAGLPAGVLQMLPGGAEVGSALVSDPVVRAISFTGSTGAGRAVGELAARHFTRAHLELGGNSALIVLPDANLDRAVALAARGTFFHQGQICMASGRHLVHDAVYDEFVRKLTALADGMTVGDPAAGDVGMGPIIDAGQRDKIDALVQDSARAGATIRTGGTYEGLFYRPTVLADAGPGIPAYDNEVFGPVASVARFSTVDEAARLAADSEYGLTLSIFTADVAAGLALADRIPTGSVHINDQTIKDHVNAPFGGVRDSGTSSRFGGAAANIDAYTDIRWITVRPAS